MDDLNETSVKLAVVSIIVIVLIFATMLIVSGRTVMMVVR